MVQMTGSTCQSARVAVTGASPKAWRATSVEEALTGQPLTDESIAAAVSGMADAADLLSDVSASAEYRAHLCEVMAKKALHQAAADAQG
jgi:carbon-monoxide dehydrogenase medium subunit